MNKQWWWSTSRSRQGPPMRHLAPFPPPPDAPTEEELHALDHPDEPYGNDHMTQGEAEAKEMQEQTSEYRRMTE